MLSGLILAPLVLLLFLNLPVRPGVRKAAPVLAALLLVGQLIAVFFLKNQAAFFMGIGLSLDCLSQIMLFTIALVELSSLASGICLIKNNLERFRFVNLLLICLVGLNAMVLVNDLFSFFIFLEISAIASFILIAFRKDLPGLEGSFKYLILSSLAALLTLLAIALLLLISGSLSFNNLSLAIEAQGGSYLVKLALCLLIGSLLVKAGAVPFHGWLPDAYMAAPTYVAVLLAGIVTKISGVYLLIRIFTSICPGNLALGQALMVIGTVSILVGAFAALNQNNFKCLLAYSSISQVGYIVLAIGCTTPLALAGAVFHFFNHAILKSLLFLNAAAVEEKTGTLDLNQLGGIAGKMPVTGTTSVIALLSTAGLPPLSGFWSKLIIILALWQANYQVYAVIALLASVITLAYFLILQRRVFFGHYKATLPNITESGWGIIVPAILLAAITIGAGLLFPYVLDSFILPIKELVVALK